MCNARHGTASGTSRGPRGHERVAAGLAASLRAGRRRARQRRARGREDDLRPRRRAGARRDASRSPRRRSRSGSATRATRPSPTSTSTGSPAGSAAEDPGLLDDYLTPDAVAFVEWPELAGVGLEGRDGAGRARPRAAARRARSRWSDAGDPRLRHRDPRHRRGGAPATASRVEVGYSARRGRPAGRTARVLLGAIEEVVDRRPAAGRRST